MLLRVDGGGTHGNARWLQSNFRESEVEKLRRPTLRDEDVGWLNVPVNNANGMDSVECISDLDTQIEHRFDAHGLPCDLMLQRQAVQKFHDDEWLPIVLADLVYRADVGVIESRGCTCLASKAFQRLRVL